MNRSIQSVFTGLVVVMVLTIPYSEAYAQGQGDQERVIDVDKLSDAIRQATSPIAEKMKTSRINEMFKKVETLASQENCNKKDLVKALRELQDEIQAFGDNWESTTSPIWQAQSSLGKSISKVRGLLASSSGCGGSKEHEKRLSNYDSRLEDLAGKIKAEKDERRKKQLKVLFSNILSLRKLVEGFGGIDLSPARREVYARIIQALEEIEFRLESLAFRLEKTRITLSYQNDFIDVYANILNGIVDVEDLVKWFEKNGPGDIGLGNEGKELDLLLEDVEGFGQTMDGFAAGMAENLLQKSSVFVDRLPSDISEEEINAEIERYSRPDKAKR